MVDQARPLDGLRVADFSRVLAGPYATQRLADLGAEVIKVERPGVGDETRSWGPPFEHSTTSYFRSVNRGKRSLALDVASVDGRAVAADLCAVSDIVIHNFLPSVAGRLGLDHDSLKAVNPNVITCSISGFGSARGDGERPGYDLVAQAESGLMAITGPPEGEPHKLGVAIVDVLTGLEAAAAILAAVVQRERDGQAREIEVSLIDSALAGLVNVAQGALATGVEPARYGNAHPSIVPYESFTARDGHIVVAAANDGLWLKLCSAIDAEDLASDERFATNPGRVAHRSVLVPELNLRFRERTAEHWIGSLSAVGVPCGRVMGVHSGLDAATRAGEDATIELEDGGRVVGAPARFDGRRMEARGAPPTLGGDGDQVLRQLGYSDDRIAALREAGVIG